MDKERFYYPGEEIIETERLYFRHWTLDDKEQLFSMAKDPDVGYRCGWPAHKTIEDSIEVIKTVFTGKENYAICMKENDLPIGCVDLMETKGGQDERELGYWLGKPYWGKGYMPEAAKELIRHGFEELGLKRIWCAYYEGNEQSKRVQEKLGFVFQEKKENVKVTLLDEYRTDYINLLTREEWEKKFF